MRLIRGLRNILSTDKGALAAIGNFDGVHRGHQILLNQLKEKAKALKTTSLIILFEPQPLEFFRPKMAVPRLTRLREKIFYLNELGIDKVLIIGFNNEFAKLDADQFVNEVLYQKLGVQEVMIGEDFRFGKERTGDVSALRQLGKKCGFSVTTIPDILFAEERISSTRVRTALKNADHALVAALLGRPYAMMGRVVYGDQLGRKLGFPTANIYLHRQVTPVLGVYAVRVWGIAEKPLFGAANVGMRPTVGGTRTLLEVHLFNFNENIYGRYVTVEFCKKLRDEEYYPTLDLLKEQIGRDAEEAYAYFNDIGEKP